MPKCPLCNQEINNIIEKYNEYQLYSCSDCDIKFFFPIEQYIYEDKYTNYDPKSPYGYNMWFRNLKKIHKTFLGDLMISDPAFNKILQIIPYVAKKNGVILDIGCGSGFLMKKLKQKGFYVYGCEVVQPLVDSLNNLGYEVYNSKKSITYPISWKKPDTIIFTEVLEHMPNPKEFLLNIFKEFPLSNVIVSVPHPERLPVSIGIKDFGDYPPHHFTRWTAKSLKKILLETGYKKVKIIECSVQWNESIMGLVLKIMTLGRPKHVTNYIIIKYAWSSFKIVCYILFYPFLYLIAQPLIIYFSYIGVKGRSLIALASPD